MITESIAIIIVILIMSYMMMRSGKTATAIAVLPIIIVPAFHIGGLYIARVVAKMTDGNLFAETRVITVAIGLLITGVLLGLVASKIKKKVARNAYVWLCGGFSVLIALIMIVRVLAFRY